MNGETILQDLRFGLRMLFKSRGFTAVTVVTLAMGIGANTAMFSIVNAWLLRPLPLKNPKELVSVWRTRSQAPGQPAFFNLYHDYLALASQNRTLQSLAATFEQEYGLAGGGEPEQIHGAVASWNFFQTVGVTPQLGRPFAGTDTHGEAACIISHALWTEHFHSRPDIIGQTIQLNRKLYRVLGVLPASFSLRVLDRPFETAVWTVITADNADYNAQSSSPVAVIGRLRNGVTIAQAETDLSALQMQLNPQFVDEPKDSGVLVVNLQQDNTRTIRSSLWLLFGAAAVLLIIACVNTGSLILGRNAQRTREFAVRVALGCGTRRLLQQLSAEILTIFAIGGAAGLLVALVLLRIFATWSPFGILPPGGLHLDGTVLAATAFVVCLTALVFGSLPALRASRVREQDALQTSNSRATSPKEQLRWRSLFVASQIAFSVVLLVSAGLLISTFARISSERLGFVMHDVFVASVPLPRAIYRTASEQVRFCREVTRTIQTRPRVRAAGAALSWQFNVDGLTPMETGEQQGLAIERLPQAATFDVGPGYFDALGIPLLRGRTFSEKDNASSLQVAVINEEMARKYFASGDAIGQRIRFRYIDQRTPTEPWLTIVGVVGNTRSIQYNHIEWDSYPAVYTSFLQRPDKPSDVSSGAQTIYLYVQTVPPADGSIIATAIHGIDPGLPLGSLRTTREIVSSLRAQPRVRATLLGSFGLLTLLLAAVGVGGVMAQMVEQRRRDIGIRIALGALASDVRRLILTQTLRLTFAGIAVGLLAAALAANVLRSLLFGISALDPATFAAVVVLLSGVALSAAYIPANRAAKLDPMDTLRSE
jgi:predicted permease